MIDMELKQIISITEDLVTLKTFLFKFNKMVMIIVIISRLSKSS